MVSIGRRFAIIIDEAHSSQGGKASAAVSIALSEAGAEEEDETTEDKTNRIMEARKLLGNASYFAFTATPEKKTLEIFGEAYDAGGQTRHRPFHSYTMKQAIQEGFILDVLRYYTPVASYYKLIKKIEGDRAFSIPSAPGRSCAATWRATTMPSGSRPRSWWITSTNRCWRSTKSVARPG